MLIACDWLFKTTGPGNLKAKAIVEASLMACFFCMWQDKKTGSVPEPVVRYKKQFQMRNDLRRPLLLIQVGNRIQTSGLIRFTFDLL